MTHRGIGSRIRWSIDSPQALRDLRSIDEEILLLGFEQGETERKALLQRYESARSRGILSRRTFSDIGSLLEATQAALSALRSEETLSIHFQNSDRIGVYQLPKSSFVNCAAELLNYDGNSILATTTDGEHGILLDLELDRLGSPTFEIEFWTI